MAHSLYSTFEYNPTKHHSYSCAKRAEAWILVNLTRTWVRDSSLERITNVLALARSERFLGLLRASITAVPALAATLLQAVVALSHSS